MVQNGTVYINGGDRAPPGKTELQKLNALVEETHHVIYEVESVFPFQIFPDKLIIDENKMTIIRRDLFFRRVFPIAYHHLISVKVNRSMFFASMEFQVARAAIAPRPLTFLSPTQADRAKSYITALMQIKKDNVDISQLDIKKVRPLLSQIGGSDEAPHLF